MENIISVKNLSIGFQSQKKKTNVVHSISFDIPKGKTIALVGESGSGKTITALSILKLLPYPSAYHSSGEIMYKNQNLLNLSNSKKNLTITKSVDKYLKFSREIKSNIDDKLVPKSLLIVEISQALKKC